MTSFFALAFLVSACKEEPATEDLAKGDPCRYGGRVYKHLEPVPSPDCNSCTCMHGGIACTLMLCPDDPAQPTVGNHHAGSLPDGGAANEKAQKTKE